jgi:hypothetical protein
MKLGFSLGGEVKSCLRDSYPAEAIAPGADYLVVGCLITEPNKYGPHSTPGEAATAILYELQVAFDKL